MDSMTIEEYNEWCEKVGIPLTRNECQFCGRRTNNCIFCNANSNQPERLSERASKEEAIV